MKKPKSTEFEPDICIKWTRNGAYVVFNPNDGPSDMGYEFDETDLTGLQSMLIDIKDHMYPGNKYDKHRVFVTLEHGHAYQCEDKKCEICEEEKCE
jgi:hypothetical protein